MKLLEITLTDDNVILIQESQVCSVAPDIQAGRVGAKIRMSNGDEWICKSPPYHAWQADTLL